MRPITKTIAIVFCLATSTAIVAQDVSEPRATVLFAIEQTPEIANPDLIGFKVQTWVNLGEDDKVIEIVKGLGDSSSLDRASSTVASLATKKRDIELLRRLVQSINTESESGKNAEKNVFHYVASTFDVEAMSKIAEVRTTPQLRDEAKFMLLDRLRWKDPSEDVVAPLKSVIDSFETRHSKFIGACYLAGVYSRRGEFNKVKATLPSREELELFRTQLAEQLPEPLKLLQNRGTSAIKLYERLAGRDLKVVRLESADKEEREKLLDELKAVADKNLVARLIDNGQSDLAIEIGCQLKLEEVPFLGGSSSFGNKKKDNFLLITRREPDLKRGQQPLLKLLDSFLESDQVEKAFALVEKLEDTDFGGYAMLALLRAPGVESATKDQIRSDLQKWFSKRLDRDPNRGWELQTAVNAFLDLEAQRINTRHAVTLLDDFESQGRSYVESLIPPLAAKLVVEGHDKDVEALFEYSEIERTPYLVRNCIRELCYDDNTEYAWSIYQKYLDVDSGREITDPSDRNQALKTLALSAVRSNREQVLMTILQQAPTDGPASLYESCNMLLNLIRIAKDRKDEKLLGLLSEYAIDKELLHYEGPMVLARLGHFEKAMELCARVPGESAMNYQMLARSLVYARAPAEIFAECIKKIDKPNRREWALEHDSIQIGYQNDPEKARAIGKLLDDLEPRYRAAYWSGVAAGLSHFCREPDQK